ncbi:MAG: hypothetical protein ACI9KE_001426 [Polyangiales bacterium]|jgi:hypothetical protein
MKVTRALFLLLVACSSCEEEVPSVTPDPNGTETTQAPEARETHVGTIRGTVRLAAGVELPGFTIEEINGPQALAPWSEHCAPARTADHHPVQMDEARGLSNVVIYAGSEDEEAFFGALPDPEPRTIPVRIEDCRLTPSVLALTRGDTLEVTQATPGEALLPVIGQSNFMEVLPEGQSRDFPIEQGGVFAMHCAFAAPCARTDLVVLYHQVHTVTGTDGSFELQIPAGQEVEIVAWHPLFSYARGTIRVDENGEAELDLELSARPEPVVPEPPAENPETPEIF